MNLRKNLTIITIFIIFTCKAACYAVCKKNISLNKEIGQMIMMGFHGTKSSDNEVMIISNYIKTGKIGGILVLNYNILDKKQITTLITQLKKLESPQSRLFVAIDQEGGNVQRLNKKNGFTDYPSAQEISANKTPEEAERIYSNMSAELKNTGININLGPVVDLNINPDCPVIGKKGRSYSKDPDKVVLYAEKFIDAHRKNGVLTSLKHFPGHGSASSDSHLGFTDVTNTWKKEELIPYRELIRKKKVDLIMSSHIFNRNIDNEFPASLSYKHIQGILREELGYNGVIITDDLQMKAISNYYGLETVIINAINSGNDILLFSDYFWTDTEIPQKVAFIVSNAIKEGKIKRERIDGAYFRIMKLKKKLK